VRFGDAPCGDATPGAPTRPLAPTPICRYRVLVAVCSTACYVVGVAQTITQRELRNDSGEIMRRLDHGETFIVTRNGTPVGELTPMRRHRFVSTDAVLAMFRNAPTIDADRFRADLDDIADQDAAPRG
jgi:prevent-host-death family protein